MNVVVIDPGYDHSGSHHEVVNLGLISALNNQLIKPVLLVSRQLREDVKQKLNSKEVVLTPYFTIPPYPPNIESQSTTEFYQFSQNFTEELINAVNDGIIPRKSFVIMHTAFAYHILAVAKALLKLPGDVFTGIYLSFMFDPGVDSEGEVFNVGRFIQTRLAFRLLEHVKENRNIPIRLETSCEAYRKAYSFITDKFKLRVHPIVTYRGKSSKSQKPQAGNVLLYLGGPKKDKGISFSIDVACRLLDEHADLNLTFHFNNEFPGAHQYVNEVNRLRQYNDGINIIEGNISADKYKQTIASTHTICMLYDPKYYRFKTSGILWDGMSNPYIKWIVSSDTWLESELREAGLVYRSVLYGDVDAAVDAIKEVAIHRDMNDRVRTQDQINYTNNLMAYFGDHLVQCMLDMHSKN